MRWEYRGKRSTDALVEFVRHQLEDPIKEFNHSRDLNNLNNAKKRMVLAHFEDKNSTEYQIYRRVAANLKEDCDFCAAFGNKVSSGGLFKSIFDKYVCVCTLLGTLTR